MEQLVLVLIIGAISLINWLIEQSGKRREQHRLERENRARNGREESVESPRSPDQEPETIPETIPDVRRILEAFGIPVSPEEFNRQSDIAEKERPPIKLPVSEFPVPAKPIVIKKKSVTAVSQPTEKKSRQLLRQAVVWREILGPPRSLLPY